MKKSDILPFLFILLFGSFAVYATATEPAKPPVAKVTVTQPPKVLSATAHLSCNGNVLILTVTPAPK